MLVDPLCLDKILKSWKSYLSFQKIQLLQRKNKSRFLWPKMILLKLGMFMILMKSIILLLIMNSSSKNAKHILNKLGLTHFFDVIVDGNSVKKSKPDPEGFIMASELTNTKPEDCVVFEDSSAGIKAGNAINMFTVGIGKSKELKIANQVYSGFNEIKLKMFQK